MSTIATNKDGETDKWMKFIGRIDKCRDKQMTNNWKDELIDKQSNKKEKIEKRRID